MKRFASVMLMVCVLAVPALAATYYAAPGGTGTGKSIDSPATVVSAVALCGSGGTVQLADGTYTGASGMIYMLGKVNVTVRAAHDGQVWLDGNGQNQPVRLDTCRGVTIEGINASRSNVSVVDVLHCHDVTIRRVCAWNAAEGNNVIFGAHWSTGTKFEDCGGWGRARKTFSCSQDCNYTKYLRCWGRWEACQSVGPKHTFEGNYNSYNTWFINCIGTWDTSTGKMPESYTLLDYYGKPWTGAGAGQYRNFAVNQPYGIFAEASLYPNYLNMCTGTRFFGCLAYVLPTQRASFTGAFFVTRLNDVQLFGCHASVASGGPAFFLATNDRDKSRGTDLRAWNLAHYGGSVKLYPEWELKNVVERLPLPQTTWKMPYEGDANADGMVDVGDLGVLSANWGTKPRYVGSWEVGDFNRDGNVDTGDIGILSSNWDTAKPLWPWPMEARIAQAMVLGGYPALSVTHQVEQAFGEKLVPEEPPVSNTTIIYPVTGGMYRYVKNGDLAIGETWTQIHNGGGSIPASATDFFPSIARSSRDAYENESAEIQRSAYRFSLVALEGKVIESISFHINLEGGSAADKVQLMQTSLLASMSDPANYARCLSQGTGRGAISLVSGLEYKVDLPTTYSETLDLAILENNHDYAGTGEVDHDSAYFFINSGDTRPRLVVTWSEPAPAGPPVGTLGLLGVGR
jgi:hypothetical protein